MAGSQPALTVPSDPTSRPRGRRPVRGAATGVAAVVATLAVAGVPSAPAFGDAAFGDAAFGDPAAVEAPPAEALLDGAPGAIPVPGGGEALDDVVDALVGGLGLPGDPTGALPDPLGPGEGEPDDGPDDEPPPEDDSEPVREPDPPVRPADPEPEDDLPVDAAEPDRLPRTLGEKLALTRSLSLAAVPVVEVAHRGLGGGPLLDYVDVPLGPRTTRDVVDALERHGASEATIARVLAPFPVAGPASYSNDWGAPRHQPTFHTHEGTDVFAPRGTPVVAPADGVVSRLGVGTSIGGNSVYVTARDGTYYYLAHLDGFAPSAAVGNVVETGEVLGFVGTTGNARGTVPHLHFEIHPAGGAPVPPLPALDRWLAEARAEVARLNGRASFSTATDSRPGAAGVPTLGVFSPAASRADSTTGGFVTAAGLVAGVVAFRRRHLFARVVAGASGALTAHVGPVRRLAERRGERLPRRRDVLDELLSEMRDRSPVGK